MQASNSKTQTLVEPVAVVRASASEEATTSPAHGWDLPRCEQCATPLELGLCALCGALFCLPVELSPFTRLALSASPFVSERDVLQAARRASALWHPLKLHLMYQALSTQQRALFSKDAKLLSSTSGRMGAFKRWCLDPLLSLERDELDELDDLESSDEQRALYEQLREGAQVLERELDTLPYALAELVDVDAHQERHRLTSRLARFFQGYSSFLGLLMLRVHKGASREQVLDQGEDDTPCLLSPELSSLIDRQLSLLTQLERLILSFERPARPRWSAR